MVNTERLCPGCMNDNGGEKICPICNFDSATANSEVCLPIKFIINNRYLVGKAINISGAEITYIGWDIHNDSIINIKEYFPIGFAHRNPDKTVSILKGGEYTFNEGLMEFAEINRIIMESQLPALVPVNDVFEENGTVYAISTAISGITLGEFLEKNGGTLKWEQARALFLPLIDTVKGMNDFGIIHRGISVDTVIVGRDGKLRISEYTVKNLRIADSGMQSEINDGYSAVELYGIEGMHSDTYTDVYGLCATLFRVLIGIVPPAALQRLNNDVMTIPAHFAEELPRHVLAALANGLQVEPQNRTRDIETFKNELVYGEVAVANNSTKKPNAEKETKETKSTKKGSSAKYAAISSVCTAVVCVLLAVVLIFTVFKDKLKNKDVPPQDNNTSFEAPVKDAIGTIDSGAEVTAKLYSVPDFRGKYYAEIIENDEYEMFEFVIKNTEYSSNYPKGTVCSQSVKNGSEVVRDTKIEVIISAGPKEIKIANVVGLQEVNAKLELLKQGFLYDNIEVLEKYDESKEPGVVLDQDPKYSTTVSPDIAVKIYVNSYKGEEETENSDFFGY